MSKINGRFRLYQRGLNYRPWDAIVYVEEQERFVCRRTELPSLWLARAQVTSVLKNAGLASEFSILASNGEEVGRSRTTTIKRWFGNRVAAVVVANPNGGEVLNFTTGSDAFRMLGRDFQAARGQFREIGASGFSLTIESEPCKYGFRFELSDCKFLDPVVALLFLTGWNPGIKLRFW